MYSISGVELFRFVTDKGKIWVTPHGGRIISFDDAETARDWMAEQTAKAYMAT